MDYHTKEAQDVVVIMVPFPCQSHLNQLLHLSCLISARNIPLHYACSATHIHQAKLRFNNTTHLKNSQIHFHEFPTPHFHSPPPNPNSPIKFPAHLQPAFESSLQLRHPTAALMAEISPTTKRLVVIHDVLMSFVIQDVVTFPNAESYSFNPTSAFHSLFHRIQKKGKHFQGNGIPQGLPSREGCHTQGMLNLITVQSDFLKLAAGSILNSCREIEGAYIDSLGNESIKRIWAIGPLNFNPNRGNSYTQQHKCLEWLDKQPPKSVLYVSFGTTISMTDEEIKELATGLEQSGEKFIWVLRDADRGDIFAGDEKRAQLPEGYEERVKEVGMVVRDWAPQVEILKHPSTGGFMSHCGWNSCLESITMGVPIATWPMHSDQPKNAFLVTDILKVGMAVLTWEKREEIVTSSTIARVVKRLMASAEGEEVRKRAEEMGGAARLAVEEGGVSHLELDSFIAHITM